MKWPQCLATMETLCRAVSCHCCPQSYGECLCVSFTVVLTIYVKKEEEKAYHAIMLDTLTAHDFKMEV